MVLFCQNSIGRVKYRETLTMYCVIWVIVVARFFPLQRNVLNLNHELSSSSPGIVIIKLKRRSSCYKFTFIEVILWQQWHRIQHCKKAFFNTKFMFLYIKCRMKRRTFNAKCYQSVFASWTNICHKMCFITSLKRNVLLHTIFSRNLL